MAYDELDGFTDEFDMLVTRAANRFVDRVYVAGQYGYFKYGLYLF